MPYINDVFISYKRGRINEQWLNDIFLPYFKEYLNNKIRYEAVVYVDDKGLIPGISFDNELFRNLLYSKCLVSIWSGLYFSSEWCVKEFLTMKHRQEQVNTDPAAQPKSLIWPILYREVDPMPSLIKNIHYLDYSEFNLVGEAFFKTEKFIKFQERLQLDIKTIGTMVLNPPALNPEWQTAEGREKVLNELNAYLEANCDIKAPQTQNPISW